MDWTILDAVFISLKVAVFTTMLSVPLAIVVGYYFVRNDFVGKSFIEALFHLPMVMPPVTTGYLLLLLLGRNGIIGEWLFECFSIRIAFAFPATVIAASIVSFPLIFRNVKVAFEMVDPRFEYASFSLGASPIETFFRVTFPIAKPGIIGGAVLAFARSLGEFGATITFAGNIEGETRTLPLAIYSSMQVPGKENLTLLLVSISICISLIAIVGSEYFYRHTKNLAIVGK